MTPTLIVLALGATALVAFGVSALSAGALHLAAPRLAGMTAIARARLLLVLALLPAFLSVAVILAALAPSFGWIHDHCVAAGAPHNHPHLCSAHHDASVPAVSILVLGGTLLARLAWTVLRLGRSAVTSHLARAGLREVSTAHPTSEARVLPVDEPHAFVIGIARPSLFVTRGLLSDRYRHSLEAVLAHERAHLRRRDALRRLVATLGLTFHLPGIARWLDARVATAQEMAADAEAASALESPARVAEALVQLARAARSTPRGALAFGAESVEARVQALLDPQPKTSGPSARTLLAAIAGIALAVACAAEAVHHGVEVLLGVFGA